MTQPYQVQTQSDPMPQHIAKSVDVNRIQALNNHAKVERLSLRPGGVYTTPDGVRLAMRLGMQADLFEGFETHKLSHRLPMVPDYVVRPDGSIWHEAHRVRFTRADLRDTGATVPTFAPDVSEAPKATSKQKKARQDFERAVQEYR